MDLTNAGFENNEVRELRFFCKEKFNGEKTYWHFKTRNQEFLKTALDGDQSNLRVRSYINSRLIL